MLDLFTWKLDLTHFHNRQDSFKPRQRRVVHLSPFVAFYEQSLRVWGAESVINRRFGGCGVRECGSYSDLLVLILNAKYTWYAYFWKSVKFNRSKLPSWRMKSRTKSRNRLHCWQTRQHQIFLLRKTLQPRFEPGAAGTGSWCAVYDMSSHVFRKTGWGFHQRD